VGSTSGTGFLPLQVFYAQHRCKKTFFTFFLFCHVFLRLLTFCLFSNVYFIFKKRWQSSERQADLQEALSK